MHHEVAIMIAMSDFCDREDYLIDAPRLLGIHFQLNI